MKACTTGTYIKSKGMLADSRTTPAWIRCAVELGLELHRPAVVCPPRSSFKRLKRAMGAPVGSLEAQYTDWMYGVRSTRTSTSAPRRSARPRAPDAARRGDRRHRANQSAFVFRPAIAG